MNISKCIDSCERDNIYKYEYKNKCYNKCPGNTKLIFKTNKCIDSCDADNAYKLEYNNECHRSCPNNTKLISNIKKCVNSCENDNIYKFEYNNECYENCPNNTKPINNSYICIDDYNVVGTTIYESETIDYIECFDEQKLIHEKNICIDDCKNDDTFMYEYNKQCFIECPYNTYYYKETKICYDNIPDGFYCNDSQLNTLDKCHENCKTCNGPPSINNNNCSKCGDENTVYYDLGNCVNNCSNGFFIDHNNNKICKCTHNRACYYCNEKSNELNLCLRCNMDEGYYQKKDEIMQDSSFVICYKDPEGYFLNEQLFYENCYRTCKFCYGIGTENDNKCKNCLEPYIFINDFDDIINCYDKCPYNYYYDIDDNNIYKCTLEDNCPSKYSKLVISKKRCIDKCQNDNQYKYEYKNKCYNSCPVETFPSFNNTYLCKDYVELDQNKDTPMLLEKELNNNDYNLSIEYLSSLTVAYYEQIGYLSNVVSKLFNDFLNIYIYKNSTSLEEVAKEAPLIDFGDCYNKIKKHYNIKDQLIVTIINNETDKDIYSKGTNEYYFSFPDTGEIIDTTNICSKNDKIMVREDIHHLMEGLDDEKEEYIYYLARQGINVFNISDKFYSDICLMFESPNKKDVPLKDRIATFFPNITLCDPGCENRGVDLEKLKAKCECSFSNILSKTIMKDISKGTLAEVIDILSSINIEVLKCISKIFDKKNFAKAFGGHFIISLLFIQLICVFIFMNRKLFIIRKHIFSLSNSFVLYKRRNLENPPRKKIEKVKKIKNSSQFKSSKDLLNNSIQNSKNKIKNLNVIKEIKAKNLIIHKYNICQNSKTKSTKIFEKSKSSKSKIKRKIKKNDSTSRLDTIKNYIINYYDENDFLDVLEKEKRSFCKFLCDKYKKNQIIINTFFVDEIFKPRPIKIILFLLIIESYIVINALFYNEEYLSELFKSQQKDRLFSFVKRRINHFIYLSSVNLVISYIIGFFFVGEDKVKRIFIRYNKDELKIKYELVSIMNEIKFGLIIFIIFSIIISIFSFLYISCFNIVYPYIQMEWITSSIFIFIVIQFSNCIIVFFECCLRYLAIKFNSEKLFKLSLLLE